VTGGYLATFPSPSQGVWYVGPVALRAYAICIIAGIVVAVWIGNRRFVARGGRPGRVTDISVFAVPFGIVGGRLYHVITDNQLYFGEGRNPWNAFAIWNGGLGIWGAIALGAVGAWIGCRYYKVPLSAYADSVAPGIAVAQAIGRLGNYFNQELFGAPTTMPWGLDVFVRTPGGVAGVIPADGTCEFPTDYVKATPEVLCGTYQPTFLYELLWCLGVAALVVWADMRFTLGGGRAFALYVAAYTLGRVWIEMLRIDPANHFLGLRINVFTSIVVFIGAVLFLYLRRNVAREDPAVVRGPDRSSRKAPAGDATP
jgi:prolipoprotein diacylglyceryl transferase